MSESRGRPETPRPGANRDPLRSQRAARPVRRRGKLRADWTQHIRAWALRLEGQLAAPPLATYEPDPRPNLERIEQIRSLIIGAEERVRSRPRSPRARIAEWWTGSRVEECRTLLQEAEIRMAGEPLLFEASMTNAVQAAERLDPDSQLVQDLYAMVASLRARPDVAPGSAAAT